VGGQPSCAGARLQRTPLAAGSRGGASAAQRCGPSWAAKHVRAESGSGRRGPGRTPAPMTILDGLIGTRSWNVIGLELTLPWPRMRTHDYVGRAERHALLECDRHNVRARARVQPRAQVQRRRRQAPVHVVRPRLRGERAGASLARPACLACLPGSPVDAQFWGRAQHAQHALSINSLAIRHPDGCPRRAQPASRR